LPEDNLDRELYAKVKEIRAASEKARGNNPPRKRIEIKQPKAKLNFKKELPFIMVVFKYLSVLLIFYAIYGLINGSIIGGYRTIHFEYKEYSHLVSIYYILISVSVLLGTSKTLSKVGTNKQRQVVASICIVIGLLLYFYSIPG